MAMTRLFEIEVIVGAARRRDDGVADVGKVVGHTFQLDDEGGQIRLW